jgi:hypothetical protein
MTKRKMTATEREAFEERYRQTMEHADRLRQLAEKAQAKLDAARAQSAS